MESLRSKCPANVILLRRKSSFVNAEVCAYIIRLVAAVLAPYMEVVQPILYLDTCKAHWAAPMLNACCAAQIWPLFIPALLTWFLQPLDTDWFSQYKFRIQRDHMDCRIGLGADVSSLDSLLDCIYIAIRDVLDVKSWAQAFDRNGFSEGQGELALKRMQELKCGPLAISCNRPSADDLRLCFPRRSTVPVDLLWKGVDKYVASACGALNLVPVITFASGSSHAAPAPISSRTRAQTKGEAVP